MRQEIETEVGACVVAHGYAPPAAIVRAGDAPASISYSNALEKALGARGLGFQLHTLPAAASQKEIVNLVAKLNADAKVHGIMVQEPLPKGIDEAAIKEALSPDKDVDGVHPVNAGRLTQVAPGGRPPIAGHVFP